MTIQHKNLASGRWQELSLTEQMANVGSEISRAVHWHNIDKKLYEVAIARALELLDFTIQDPRWHTRLKELVRVRELICDAVFGDKAYKTSLKDLDKYFLSFAFAARIRK